LTSSPRKKPLRYRADRWIRHTAMRAVGWIVPASRDIDGDLRGLPIKKILLVRANFRIGNAILALPAIARFRENFPGAEIDFVGAPISKLLFQGQPLKNNYFAPRRFPYVLWQYPQLILRLRANRYDLAVDVSYSQSGLGSFIVGLSGARIRAGLSGKWDGLFNLRIPRLKEKNKYAKLTDFLAALGLRGGATVGALEFSAAEQLAGRHQLDAVFGPTVEKTIGVFVGARKLRGKRWPLANFVEVMRALAARGFHVVAFVGPEEGDIVAPLKESLGPSLPVVCEPSLREFAAMVAHLDLFICCDSGPMHLACAVGTPVVAIFQPRDVARWAPPPSAARALSGSDGVSAAAVLAAALEELAHVPEAEAAHLAETSAPR
jgi:heptosyltransferase-3